MPARAKPLYQTEADVRAPVVRWAKAHDVGHTRMSFRAGVTAGKPDDLFDLPNGRSLWVEFKRPRKRPKLIQEYHLGELERRHHAAMWADDPEPVIARLTMLAALPPRDPWR